MPLKVTEARSPSMRLSMKRSVASRKLLQWNWVWKPKMVLPSKPSIICSRQGQMLKVSEFGQGMCQKVTMVAVGQSLPHHARQKREVVVLREHDRVVLGRLLHHGVGETRVHSNVMLPVALAEDRPDESYMA